MSDFSCPSSSCGTHHKISIADNRYRSEGLPKQVPLTACVSSKGLQPLIDESDPHFSAESQLILGERYAKALLSLPASDKGLRVLFIGDSITDGNWGNKSN